MLTLAIEYVPLSALTPYAKNAKLHPQAQIENIKTSILHCGMCDPIGVWGVQNLIVEGHGRYEALKQLGAAERVPIIHLDHLSDEQRREYTLTHNKTTLDTGFDFDLLQSELAALDFGDFHFDWGLPEQEQAPMTVTEDEAPLASEDAPTTQPGDMWLLGDHRLLCGDSTDPEAVAQLMGDNRAALLFTSPPYADMREYNGGKDLSVETLSGFIAAYASHCALQAVNLGIQRKDGEIVPYWDVYIEQAHRCGLKLLAWNVWDKGMAGSIGQQQAMIPIRHEWIFVFGASPVDAALTWAKKPESIKPNGVKHRVRQKDGTFEESGKGVTDRAYKKMESIVSICSETGSIRSEHPAVFPVMLPAEYIQAFAPVGGIVAEPFGGSGTTLIACEQLKRACRCMELDPRYCDVIVRRWSKLTCCAPERIPKGATA